MSELIIPYADEILPQEEVEELPYYPDLVKIRTVLEKGLKHFPHCCCAKAGRVVKLVTGLEELVGKYEGPRKCDWHAWNFDESRGLYIDLTQDQFLELLPPITVLPSTTKILLPNKDETKLERKITTKGHYPVCFDLIRLNFPDVIVNC